MVLLPQKGRAGAFKNVENRLSGLLDLTMRLLHPHLVSLTTADCGTGKGQDEGGGISIRAYASWPFLNQKRFKRQIMCHSPYSMVIVPYLFSICDFAACCWC